MSYTRYIVTGSGGNPDLAYDSLAAGSYPYTSLWGTQKYTAQYQIFLNKRVTGPLYLSGIYKGASGADTNSAIVFPVPSSSQSYTALPAGELNTAYLPESSGTVEWTVPSAATTAYSRKAYTVGGTASNSQGSVSQTGPFLSVDGDFVVTATPNYGYAFKEWRVGSASGAVWTKNVTGNVVVVQSSETSDITLYAIFRSAYHTVTVVPPLGGSVSVYASSTAGGSPTTLLLSGVTTQTAIPNVVEGTVVRLVASVPFNYAWTNWTTSYSTTLSAQDVNITIGTSDLVATANSSLRTLVKITLTNADPTLGHVLVTRLDDSSTVLDLVDGDPYELTVYNGLGYRFLAVPYLFLNTLEDWVRTIGEAASETFTTLQYDVLSTDVLTGDRTQIYNFGAKDTCPLTFSASDGTNAEAGHPEIDQAILAGCGYSLSKTKTEGLAEGNFVVGDTVVLSALPASRWIFDGIRVIGDSVAETLSSLNPRTFTVVETAALYFRFSAAEYTVSLEVDAPSAAVSAGEVSISLYPSGGELALQTNPFECAYGVTVYLQAIAASGFVFEGWYKEGVKLEGMGATAYLTVAEDTALTAKFAAVISLSAVNNNGSNGAAWFVTAEGMDISQAPATLTVIIGDTFYVRHAELSGATYCKGFYADSALLFGSPDETVSSWECDGALTLSAEFDTSVSDLVTLRMTNDPPNVENAGFGRLSASSENAKSLVTEILESDWDNIMYFGTPGTTSGEGRNRYYTILRGFEATILAVPLVARRFKRWLKSTVTPAVDEGGPTFSDEVLLSAANPHSFPVTDHTSVRAEWYSAEPVQVFAKYATGSSVLSGELRLLPLGTATGSNAVGTFGEYLESDTVSIVAIPANGYKFTGWYSSAAGTGTPLSVSQTYTVTVGTTPVVVYAKMELDASKLYLWEGDTTPKYAVWRSKRYETAVPFDPGCARVLAEGYPVTLSVYACSSPDSPSPAVPTKTVTVFNERPVRLPSSRKERYFEIEVSGSFALRSVIVSTSPEGLRQ